MLYRGVSYAKLTNPVLVSSNNQQLLAAAVTGSAIANSSLYLFEIGGNFGISGKKALSQTTINQYLTATDFTRDNYPEYLLGYGVYDFQVVPSLMKKIKLSGDYRLLPVNMDSDDYIDLFYSGTDSMGIFLSIPPILAVQASSNTSITDPLCVVSGRSISISATTTYKIGTDPNKAAYRIKYAIGGSSKEISGILKLPYILPNLVDAGVYQITIYYKDSNLTEVSTSCTAEITSDSVSKTTCFYKDEFEYSNNVVEHGWFLEGSSFLRPKDGYLRMDNDRKTSSEFSLSLSRDVSCPYVDLYYEFSFNASSNVDFEAGISDNYGESVQVFGVSGGKFRMYSNNGSTRKVVGFAFVPGKFYNIQLRFDGIAKKVIAYYCTDCKKSLAGNTIYNETIGEGDWVNSYNLANYEDIIPYSTAYVTVYDGNIVLDRIFISSSEGAVMWSSALKLTNEQAYLQSCDVRSYCNEFSALAKKSLKSGTKTDIYCTIEELGTFIKKVPKSADLIINTTTNETTEGGCFKQALDYCTRYSYPFEYGSKYITGEIQSEGISVCGTILTASVGTSRIAVPIWNVGENIVKTYPLQIVFLVIIAIIVIAIYVRSKS
jgi:hypothetical protein